MNNYFRQDAAIHNEITHIYAYFCIQSIYHLIFLVALSITFGQNDKNVISTGNKFYNNN